LAQFSLQFWHSRGSREELLYEMKFRCAHFM